MKALVLNLQSGIAGDMLVGALLDAGADRPAFWEALRALPLPAREWHAHADKVIKQGITATHFQVHAHELPTARGHHAHPHGGGHSQEHAAPAPAKDRRVIAIEGPVAVHRHLPDIERIVREANLPPRVEARALLSFRRLGEAEARVHGIPVDQVHFHEVGAVDAIVDIVGACLAAEVLGIERVFCGPVAVGAGTVRCEHGTMPVPVPAVVNLLAGAPTVFGTANGELTTPTGAALLLGLGAEFGERPAGRLLASGYGAGTKDLPDRANVVQAVVIELADTPTSPTSIEVLECNLDDAPGEQLGYLLPRLLEAGALDVAVLPCTMKKGRPGMVVQVLVEPARREAVGDLLLRETTTFGYRWHAAGRVVLRREARQVDTPAGTIAVKAGYHPATGELLRLAPEYESCRAAAERTGLPLATVFRQAVDAAWQAARD